MTWKPLPDDVPLDGEQQEPPASMGGGPDAALHSAVVGKDAPADMQTGDTGGFAPLLDDAQLDGAPAVPAPSDKVAVDQPGGFTDEQKQAVFEYLPKAKDAADLQKFAEELSGGKVHIANAENVLNEYRKGARTFGFQNSIGGTPATPPEQPNDLRSQVGQGIVDAIDGIIPGFGDLIGQAQQSGSGKAFTEHTANALAGEYGPEAGGLIDTLLSPSQYGDFGENLGRNIAHERATLTGDSEGHPYASAAGELTGVGLATPLIGAAAEGLGAARLAGTAGPAARTFAQAAGEGAVYGSGAAGPGNRGTGAAEGAATAAVLAPVAMAVPAIYQAGKSVLSETPSMARRIISKAIEADQNTPSSVAATVSAANSNDVPMAIADTGENVRGLLAAAARASGPARTVARDALEQRQAALADRVTGAIQRDLGPVANPHEVADTLMTKARNEAAPIYERLYSQEPVASPAIDALAARPSMQKALKNAYRIAKEEGRDPEALGFRLGEDGEVKIEQPQDALAGLRAKGTDKTITSQSGRKEDVTLYRGDDVAAHFAGRPKMVRTYTPQTLDYIKRGMDDVVESYKDPVTGRYNFDTEGRAVNNTLRSFLGTVDKLYPDYAKARAAYAGPVKGIAAMNTGRKLLNLTADDIEARLRDMSPYEKEMAALGARRAMAELVASKGDTADVVHALVGTGKKRAMLARLFGDRKAFGRFVQTLGQEREGFRTFKQARLGSPTAANLEDDATLKLASGAADMISHGLPIGTAIRYALKFGVGKIGDKAKQQVAALLSNTDPARFEELALQLRQEAIRRGLFNRKAGIVAGGIGNAGAVTLPKTQAQ